MSYYNPYRPTEYSDNDRDDQNLLNPNGDNFRNPFGSNNSSTSALRDHSGTHGSGSNSSTNILQEPPRTHSRSNSGAYGRSSSYDQRTPPLEQPIFNTSHLQPPGFSPIPSNTDFEEERYEMNPYPPQNKPNRSGLTIFRPGFLPKRGNEETPYDQNIRFEFKGDSYNLSTFQVRESPEPQPLQSSPYVPSFVVEGQDEETLRYQRGASPSAPKASKGQFSENERVKKPQPKAGFTTGINGKLVLDCPVATNLLSTYPDYKAGAERGGLSNEFYFMRYTAVTCGPSNFYREGYLLRTIHYAIPRKTEIMVVITMYNENDVLLGRTLKGVLDNIKYMESKKRSSMWGEGSWKKIIVCIISDGRTKINDRAQALLAGLGVYQEGLASGAVNDKPVQAHMYEYTSRIGIKRVTDTVELTLKKVVPTQFLFCLKEKNAKKINSHRWCFQAIGQVLDPKVVVLLDAGTQPTEKSLYRIWKEFDMDPRVAGCCGEIKALLRTRQMFTNPMVYAQNFEYKMSNILDKPMESAFGFISVLPGAFSAYRYIALQNDINGNGPLEKYFKGEFLHASEELDKNDDEYQLKKELRLKEANVFTSNMYLAEDRILCYELVAKKDCGWLLRYCKGASAATDVPESLAEFILQRRRWLNGSFFAAIYSLVHFPKVWGSSHSISRKIMLHIEFLYQFVNLVLSWFAIGSYFLVFRILSTSLANPDLGFKPGKVFSFIFLWLYLASLVTTFVLSFGNKPKGTEKFYIVIVYFFAILMGYMIFAAIYLAAHSIHQITKDGTKITIALFFKNAQFRDLVIATSSTYLLYFVASFIYFQPAHMFTSFIQYLLLSPSYINILNIYAFCNIDDISWGTKGDTGGVKLALAEKGEDGVFRFQFNVSVEPLEINDSYNKQVAKINQPEDKPDSGDTKKTSSEDYYAFVRSMTVLVWMFTNSIIVTAVLNTGGFDYFGKDSSSRVDTENRSTIFLTVILWMVAIMALFRFTGCIAYLVTRIKSKVKSPKKVPLTKK